MREKKPTRIIKSNINEAGSPITVKIRPLLSSIHLMKRFFNGDVDDSMIFSVSDTFRHSQLLSTH